MQKIVVFQKFPNIEEASDLILLLNNNNIPFEIDDRGQRFSLVSNPMDDLIKIKINETDVEKANLLLKKSENENFKNHNV
ncbi:MAG: hypothetical protein K9J13_12010 [Saprospiraceae bacterium]|nr:hypothetical protein [Saprospiraceae bacterium]